jgi:shikimate kinase
MNTFAPSEMSMWEKPIREPKPRVSDEEINAKYATRELRIVTESNREQLPNFVQALKRPNWMDLRPFYQRRPRWEKMRQSKLIESFIMNVPVPPLFVYEADLAKYEVMDGQQRITALLDFYTNKLTLQGLEQWPELNGRIYDNLPSEIRKGLDRRSISYIVLLKESASNTEEEDLLRQEVFERLNTGGISLGHQEIRNAVYQGKFNNLLLELTRNDTFRRIWAKPPYSEEAEKKRAEELTSNRTYVLMRDAEIILRFFALRHADRYQRGMKGFLDLYMLRARAFGDDDIPHLRALFEQTVTNAWDVYGDLCARPWDAPKNEWANRPQVAFADAVMVGVSRHLDQSDRMVERRNAIVAATRDLFVIHDPGTFTGQKNTKKDVQDRIRLFDEMLARELMR